MKQSYLNLARSGKNHWWRYCIGMLFIILFWGYVSMIFVALSTRLAISIGIVSRNWPYIRFVMSSVRDIFSSVSVFLVLKWLHQRKFSTVISPSGKLSTRRVLVTTTVVLFVLLIPYLIGRIIDPTLVSDVFKLKAKSWFPLIALSVAIQSAGEEFIYRGYLMQGLSLINSQPVFSVLFSSLAFAYLHYLPSLRIPLEEWNQFLFYFVFGVICAVVTIKDNRIERAIGIHAGWNIFQTLMSGIGGRW